MAPEEHRPPAPAEQVHLPGPTFLPALVALGVTLVVVGVVLSPYMLLIGTILFLVATVRWIREVREDISELPLDH